MLLHAGEDCEKHDDHEEHERFFRVFGGFLVFFRAPKGFGHVTLCILCPPMALQSHANVKRRITTYMRTTAETLQ